MGIGDWGLGIWGLGFGAKTPNPPPQTKKPKPQKKNDYKIFFI